MSVARAPAAVIALPSAPWPPPDRRQGREVPGEAVQRGEEAGLGFRGPECVGHPDLADLDPGAGTEVA